MTRLFVHHSWWSVRSHASSRPSLELVDCARRNLTRFCSVFPTAPKLTPRIQEKNRACHCIYERDNLSLSFCHWPLDIRGVIVKLERFRWKWSELLFKVANLRYNWLSLRIALRGETIIGGRTGEDTASWCHFGYFHPPIRSLIAEIEELLWNQVHPRFSVLVCEFPKGKTSRAKLRHVWDHYYQSATKVDQKIVMS